MKIESPMNTFVGGIMNARIAPIALNAIPLQNLCIDKTSPRLSGYYEAGQIVQGVPKARSTAKVVSR